jgi:hypothetical protein
MTSAQKILEAWRNKDEQSLQDLQPRQTTGLGLLLNYMVNPAVPVATRWNTIADYVQQDTTADNASMQLLLASVLTTKDPPEDQAANNWRWSTADQDALVSQMAANTGANTYKAFQTLAAYTYKGQTLPIKVGCQIGVKYLKKTA